MIAVANDYNEADVSACLHRMLTNTLFAQAERQKRLLRYLVEATLAGKTGLLKGYTIGVEVFDRKPDFDPAIDAIVRVQAGQLRAKLREYYQGEGHHDPFRFELPKGGYAVQIVIQGQESSAAPAAGNLLAASGLSPLAKICRSLTGVPIRNRATSSMASPRA